MSVSDASGTYPTVEDYNTAVKENALLKQAQMLAHIDTHDLHALANFWRGEIKTLEAVGRPLPQDLALAKEKLRSYRNEIERRNNLI